MLFRGIPFEFAAEAHGDDAEMADGGGAMSDLDFADGLLPGANALEEIAHMVVADVQALG